MISIAALALLFGFAPAAITAAPAVTVFAVPAGALAWLGFRSVAAPPAAVYRDLPAEAVEAMPAPVEVAPIEAAPAGE